MEQFSPQFLFDWMQIFMVMFMVYFVIIFVLRFLFGGSIQTSGIASFLYLSAGMAFIFIVGGNWVMELLRVHESLYARFIVHSLLIGVIIYLGTFFLPQYKVTSIPAAILFGFVVNLLAWITYRFIVRNFMHG